MINKKKLNFDELSKSIKGAGLVGLEEATNIGTSAILGTTKTLKEASWEKKILIGGLLGNLAAGILDMDLPFANLGIESMAGLDAFIDNASDVAIGAAGASLAYKLANNIQQTNSSNKSVEELLTEMGIDLSDDTVNETTIKQEEKDLNEEQELMAMKQLAAKYGFKLEK